MASIFYQLYHQIEETGVARLFEGYDGYGDGEQKRDFIYVKDVVKVNLWFWREKGPSGIYNCGTGKAHTYNEAAQAVIDAMGKGKIEYRPFPEVLKGKYQSFTEADTTALLAAGYDGGFTDMKDAVKEYCDFLKVGGYFTYGE
jgi:ADP-L-glycero-D-manno-heptose 6-epimerase